MGGYKYIIMIITNKIYIFGSKINKRESLLNYIVSLTNNTQNYNQTSTGKSSLIYKFYFVIGEYKFYFVTLDN